MKFQDISSSTLNNILLGLYFATLIFEFVIKWEGKRGNS